MYIPVNQPATHLITMEGVFSTYQTSNYVSCTKIFEQNISGLQSNPVHTYKWFRIAITAKSGIAKIYHGLSLITPHKTYTNSQTTSDLGQRHLLGQTSPQSLVRLTSYSFYKSDIGPYQIDRLARDTHGLAGSIPDCVQYYLFNTDHFMVDAVSEGGMMPRKQYVYTSSASYSDFVNPYLVQSEMSLYRNSVSSVLMVDDGFFELPLSNARSHIFSHTWEIWVKRKSQIIPNLQYFTIFQFLKGSVPVISLQIEQPTVNKEISNYRTHNQFYTPAIVSQNSFTDNSWVYIGFTFSKREHYAVFGINGVTQSVIGNQNLATPIEFTNIKFGGNSNIQAQLVLSEFRVWNCYRPIREMRVYGHVDLRELNHPNIIQYFTFDQTFGDGYLQKNWATVHGMPSGWQVLDSLGGTISYHPSRPTICEFGYYFDPTSKKCSNTHFFESQLILKKPKIQSIIEIFHKQTQGKVSDFWIQVEQIAIGGIQVVSTNNSQVFLTSANAGKDLKCVLGNNALSSLQAYYIKQFQNKWIHVLFASQGVLNLKIYLNNVRCIQDNSYNTPAQQDLKIVIGGTSFPSTSQIRFRELRTWKDDSYLSMALQLMNSTLLDPFKIEGLAHYYKFSGYDDLGTNPYFITPMLTDPDVRLDLSPANLDQGEIKVVQSFKANQFCDLGMFKGPYPTYDRCFMPRPVLKMHEEMIPDGSTVIDQHDFAQFRTDLVKDQFSVGFWFTPNRRLTREFNYFYTSHPSNQFEFQVQLISGIYEWHIKQGGISETLQSYDQQEIHPGKWYMAVHTFLNGQTMIAIYRRNGVWMYSQGSASGTPQSFPDPFIKLKLGASSNSITKDMPFTMRNFHIYNRMNLHHMKTILEQAPLVSELKRSARFYFSSISTIAPQSGSNHIVDFKGGLLGQNTGLFNYWTVDQTFPYNVCDERFHTSDAKGTCGGEGELVLNDQLYQITATPTSEKNLHWVDSGSQPTQITSDTFTVRVWIYTLNQHKDKDLMIWQMGNDNDTVLASSVFMRLFVHQMSSNSSFQFSGQYSKSDSVTNPVTLGSSLSYEKLQSSWKLVTLSSDPMRLFINTYQHFDGGVQGPLTGKYHHYFCFGCKTVLGPSTKSCFQGRYRDFVVINTYIAPNDFNMYSVGEGYHSPNVLYFSPLKGMAEEYFQFIKYVPSDTLPMVTKGILTDTTLISYSNQEFIKPHFFKTSPYYTRDYDKSSIEIKKVLILQQSGIQWSFTAVEDYNQYTFRVTFLTKRAYLNTSDLLIRLENKFTVSLKHDNQEILFNIESLNVYTSNIMYSYVGDYWNELVVSLSSVSQNKRKVFLNQVDLFHPSTFINPSNMLQGKISKGEVVNIHQSKFTIVRNYELWRYNFASEPGYDSSFFTQQSLTRQALMDYYRLTPIQEGIIYSVLFEDIYPFDTTKISGLIYDQGTQKSMDYTVDGKETAQVYQEYHLCSRQSEVWNGYACQNTSVLLINRREDANIKGIASILPLPLHGVGVGSGREEFTIEFWYLSCECEYTSDTMTLFSLRKSGNNNDVIKLYNPNSSDELQIVSWQVVDTKVAKDQFVYKSRWSNVVIHFKRLGKIDFYFHGKLTQQDHGLQILTSDNFEQIQPLVIIGDNSDVRRMTMQHFKIYGGHVMPTLQDAKPSISSLLTHWPLTLHGDGHHLYELSKGFKVLTGPFMWVAPTYITLAPVPGLIICELGYTWMKQTQQCRDNNQIGYETSAIKGRQPFPFTPTSDNDDEWTVETWIKYRYDHPSNINNAIKLMQISPSIYIQLEQNGNVVKDNFYIQTSVTQKVIDKETIGKWNHIAISNIKVYNEDEFQATTFFCQVSENFKQRVKVQFCKAGPLKASFQIFIGLVDGVHVPSSSVKIQVKEFRFWSEYRSRNKLSLSSMINLPRTTPNLIYYLKIKDNKWHDIISQTSGPLDGFYQVDHTLTPNLMTDCPYHTQASPYSQNCLSTSHNAFTLTSSNSQIDFALADQLKIVKERQDMNMGFSFTFQCKAISAQPDRYIVRFNSFYTLQLKQNTNVEVCVSGNVVRCQDEVNLITCATTSEQVLVVVQFMPYLKQVRTHFYFSKNRQKVTSTISNMKNTDYLWTSNYNFHLSGQNGENSFTYRDLNLYIPAPNDASIIWAFHARTQTQGLGFMGQIYNYHMIMPQILVKESIQNYFVSYAQNKAEILIPKASVKPETMEQVCPFGMVWQYSRCRPHSALVLKGIASQKIKHTPFKVHTEVTHIFWAKIRSWTATNTRETIYSMSNLIGFVIQNDGANGYFYMSIYHGVPSPVDSQLPQKIISPLAYTNWKQYALVLKPVKSSTPWVTTWYTYIDSIPNGNHQSPIYSYQKVSIGALTLATARSNTEVHFSYLQIYGIALSPSELKYLMYTAVNSAQYRKHLLVYYMFIDYNTNHFDILRSSETILLSPSGVTNSILMVKGRQAPMNGMWSKDGKYTRMDKYYFIPKDQSPSTAKMEYTHPAITVAKKFSMSVCIYGMSQLGVTLRMAVDLKGFISYQRMRKGSDTEWYQEVTHAALLGGTQIVSRNKIQNYVWSCQAFGIQSSDEPNYDGSEVYFMDDSKGAMQSDIRKQTPTTRFIGGHFSGSYTRTVLQSDNTAGCNCFMAQLKVFSDFIHPNMMYQHIMRYEINHLDHPSLIQYFKLNEVQHGEIYEYVTSTPIQFKSMQNTSYPYWAKPGRQLVICASDSMYSGNPTIKVDGICQNRLRAFQLKSKFEVQINNPMPDSTVTLWYARLVIFAPFDVTKVGRYSYKFHKNKTIHILDDVTNTLVFVKDATDTDVVKQWIFMAVRWSEIMRQIIVFRHAQQWDIQHVDNVKLPVNPAGIQKFSILNGYHAQDQAFLSFVAIYSFPLHETTIKFRFIHSLTPSEIPSLVNYYILLKSDFQGPLNEAHQLLQMGAPMTAQHEWKYFSEVGLQQHYAQQCYQKGYLWTGTYCTRSQFDCSQCQDPNGHNECYSDPSSPGGCLKMSSSKVPYDAKMKEYGECHPLCEECTVPFTNQQCTKCVMNYKLGPIGVCELTCPDGQAFDTTTTIPICKPCTSIGCNCPQDDFGNCTSCVAGRVLIVNGGVGKDEVQCLTGCGSGKYHDPKESVCKQCHPICEECNGETNQNCVKCADPTFKLSNSQGGSCSQVFCGRKKYLNNLKCKPCHPTCQSCNGPKQADCIECEINEYIMDDLSSLCINCTSIGPPNTYKPSNQLSKSQHCSQYCNTAGRRYDHQYPYVVNPNNYCNDGNLNNGDGCDSNCQVEPGYICIGGNLTTPDLCKDKSFPTATIQEIVSGMTIKVKFSEKMKAIVDPIQNGKDVKLSITGKQSKYDINKVKFRSSKIHLTSVLEVDFIVGQTLYGTETITIQFLNKTIFMDISGNEIKQDNVQGTLPKLKYLSPLAYTVSNTGGNALLIGSISSIGLNFILSILIGSALDTSWDFLNALQILYYLPLIAIYYPPFLRVILGYLAFALADVQLPFEVPDILGQYIIFSFTIQDQPLNDTYAEFGIGNSILVKLYSTKIFMWVCVAALYPVIRLIKVLLSPLGGCVCEFIKKKVSEVELGYRFNTIIRMIIELYLEMTLFAFINVYQLNYSSYPNVAASFFGIAFICIVTFVPSLFSIIISYYFRNIGTGAFKSHFGAITEGMKVKKGQHALQHYTSFFLYRRFMYVQILVFLRFWPTAQMCLCVFKNLITVMVLIIMRPYQNKRQLALNIYNEATISITFIICCTFIFQYKSELFPNTMAYIVSGIIIIFGLANIIMILLLLLIDIGRVLRILPKKQEGKVTDRVVRSQGRVEKVQKFKDSGQLDTEVAMVKKSPGDVVPQIPVLNPFSQINDTHPGYGANLESNQPNLHGDEFSNYQYQAQYDKFMKFTSQQQHIGQPGHATSLPSEFTFAPPSLLVLQEQQLMNKQRNKHKTKKRGKRFQKIDQRRDFMNNQFEQQNQFQNSTMNPNLGMPAPIRNTQTPTQFQFQQLRQPNQYGGHPHIQNITINAQNVHINQFIRVPERQRGQYEN